jgi:hypothetical protein
MAPVKGKHIIAEIEGVRCSVVESGAGEARVAFLRDLLTLNGFEVKTEKEKAKDGTPLETSVIGVTDIFFNTAIVIYQHRLKRADGTEVSPAFWNQWDEGTELPYWQVKR